MSPESPGITPASFAFNAGGTDLYIASRAIAMPAHINLLDLNLATPRNFHHGRGQSNFRLQSHRSFSESRHRLVRGV